jgi:ketosteroid isomerase-like protein
MRDALRPHGVTVNGVSMSEIILAHPRQGVPVSADENTRLAQSAYEAFGRGDMAALAEVMADDIEWVNPGDPADDPNAGTFKGKEAVLGWFGGLASTLDFTTFEPREFIAQNDKVVSLVYAEATVRTTGRAVVNHEAHVWTFLDGKVARFQIYSDTAAAAAAHRVE